VAQTNRNKSTLLEETDAVQIHPDQEKSIHGNKLYIPETWNVMPTKHTTE